MTSMTIESTSLLSLGMRKRGCNKKNSFQQGFDVKGDNNGNVVNNWVRPPDRKPKLKTSCLEKVFSISTTKTTVKLW